MADVTINVNSGGAPDIIIAKTPDELAAISATQAAIDAAKKVDGLVESTEGKINDILEKAKDDLDDIPNHLVFEGEDSILAPEIVEVGDAINRANTAAAGAEKVNATLSGTNLTITNRNGQSTTINTKGETGAKGDKGDKGDPGDVSLAQLNEVRDELQSEITELENEIYGTTLHVVGFGTNGSSAGVKQYGDIYYNTNTKLLRQFYNAGGYDDYLTIPFTYERYINNSDKKEYIYNGTELVEEAQLSKIKKLENEVKELSAKSIDNTLADYEKRSKGIYVSYENSVYSVNTESSSWESWVIDATDVTKIFATLGKGQYAHCNIIFFRSYELTAKNIISHAISPENSGIMEYNVENIPTGCRCIVISNRIATLSTPSATITIKQNIYSIIKQKANQSQVDKIVDEVEKVDTMASPFYATKQKLTKFENYQKVIEAYDALMNLYPNIITKHNLGSASDGQKMYEYVISSGVFNKEGLRGVDLQIEKPTILIMAGIHGYEPSSAMSLYTFISDMLSCVYSLRTLRNNFVFKIIPCANPYGYNANKRGNANNVDLNRNFDAEWVLDGDPTNPTSYYSGASAASEPETKILQKWMNDNSNASCLIDFHNSSFVNEISCMGGLTIEGETAFKKQYLVGVTNIVPYLIKNYGLPETSNFAYTYGGSSTSLHGTTGQYRTKVGIVGGVLETSENINSTGIGGTISIAIGAEVLGNALIKFGEKNNVAESVE